MSMVVVEMVMDQTIHMATILVVLHILVDLNLHPTINTIIPIDMKIMPRGVLAVMDLETAAEVLEGVKVS